MRHRLAAITLGILAVPLLASAAPRRSAPTPNGGTVNWLGNAFDVSHAYAMKDPSSEWVEVLLTKEPLTADALNNRDSWATLAKLGRLHALLLRLGKGDAILATGVYNKTHGLYNITGADQVFKATVFTDKRVEGTARVEKGTHLEQSLRYEVRFATDVSTLSPK